MKSECCLTESIFKSALAELKPDSLMSDVLHVSEDCLLLPNFNLKYDLTRFKLKLISIVYLVSERYH